MAKQGWISLHRQIQDHWLWEDKPFSKGQAWVDLLLLANHEDNKFLLGNELVKVEAGSFITSELKLMERWGWGKSKTRAFLEMLQNDGMIVKKSDRKKTTITINNYGAFQDFETSKQTTNRPRADRKQTTNRPRADTNNNDNNDNNENNDNKLSYCDDPELNKTVISFVAFRKSIKKPMSEHAVKLMINKLNKMTSDVSEQIEILNQSIMNGWQGIFPLKEQQQKQIKKGSFETDDFFEAAVMRSWESKEKPKTAADDEKIRERMERLKSELH
jgi:DNA replication protein DnaD